ncbi:MAG: methyltransferase domain-containing protein [Parcubacteria group bacterium]|nr:methyltransferase domain-containing protein [Parcubacteria group bacterium]
MKITQAEATKLARKLYNRIGRAHEKIRDEGKIDSEVLDKLLKFLPKNLSGKTIFDAGGGSGYFSHLALQRGAKRVICMDISDFMLNLAKKRKKMFNLTNLEVKKGDFTKTKLPANSIDIILSIYSLPQVSDLHTVFKEFYRILKPRGSLFVASDYYEIKNKNLIGQTVQYNLGKIKLTGFMHTKPEIQQLAHSLNFFQKKFFVVKKPTGLKIDKNFKWKKSVKIHSFGAEFAKN